MISGQVHLRNIDARLNLRPSSLQDQSSRGMPLEIADEGKLFPKGFILDQASQQEKCFRQVGLQGAIQTKRRPAFRKSQTEFSGPAFAGLPRFKE